MTSTNMEPTWRRSSARTPRTTERQQTPLDPCQKHHPSSRMITRRDRAHMCRHTTFRLLSLERNFKLFKVYNWSRVQYGGQLSLEVQSKNQAAYQVGGFTPTPQTLDAVLLCPFFLSAFAGMWHALLSLLDDAKDGVVWEDDVPGMASGSRGEVGGQEVVDDDHAPCSAATTGEGDESMREACKAKAEDDAELAADSASAATAAIREEISALEAALERELRQAAPPAASDWPKL